MNVKRTIAIILVIMNIFQSFASVMTTLTMPKKEWEYEDLLHFLPGHHHDEEEHVHDEEEDHIHTDEEKEMVRENKQIDQGTSQTGNLYVYAASSSCPHTFGRPNTVSATCKTAGYSYNKCTKCGLQNKFNQVAALGHSYTKITKSATCLSTGTKKCSRCTATTTIPATGHQFGGQPSTVSSTCTTGGYSYTKCSRCSEINKHTTTKALGHNYTKVTKEATCVAKGTKKCSRCSSTTSVAATGKHSYTVISTAATCTTKGTKKCETCTATQSISALGHKYEGRLETVSPTCTKGGYQYNKCSRCNKKNEVNPSNSLGHNYTQVTKEPTCISSGTKKCSRCSATTSVAATGVHNYNVTVTPATCTTGGTDKCSGCTSTKSISALNHQYGGRPETVTATCTSGGYTYVACQRSNCGARNRYNEIGPYDHNYTVVISEATCTTAGTVKCSGCSSSKSISPGHQYGGRPGTVSATCTSGGYTYVACQRANCNSISKISETEKLDHKYTQVVKEATCAEAGIIKCSTCNDTINSSATGNHSYNVVVKKASCIEKGTKKCSTCPLTKEIPIEKHQYGTPEIIKTKNSTCETQGYVYRTCISCKQDHKLETLPLASHTWEEVSEADCKTPGSKKCANCKKVESIPINKSKHKYELTTPNCTENGIETCKNCLITREISMQGHDLERETQVKAPTCIEAGYTEKYCKRCEKTIKVDEKAPLGHDLEEEYRGNREIHWKKCRRCEDTLNKGIHVFNDKEICTICERNYNIDVEVSGLTIIYSSLEMFTKGVYTVYAKIMPSEVKGEVLTWTSSNPSIATIDNQGTIIPLKKGIVTITVTASNGTSSSQEFIVREIAAEASIHIGDILGLNDEFRGYDLSTIGGNKNAVKILSNTMLIGVEEGSVLLSADEEAYFRVHVIRQSKLSKQQVINLTGAPPTSVDGEEIDYIKFTTGNGGEYLRAYFNQYVSPNLCGMSLDVTLPSWEFSEGEERIFEEWILMMYGHLKPTPEEMLALLANYAEPLPIIGTAVTVQKTIVSYQNGKIMEGLIRSGIVSLRVVGDVLLVKDMWKAAVEFSFTDDAMEILTTSAVGQMDDVVRVGLINQLDDYERLINGGTGDWTKGIRATQEVIPGTNIPKSFVMEGKYVNGTEVWVHGNATKHMGQYINSAKGSILVENEMMQSFKSAVDQVLTKPLQSGKNFFDNIGGWEIGINGETGVIYHALMN